jgi:hypothetical protein
MELAENKKAVAPDLCVGRRFLRTKQLITIPVHGELKIGLLKSAIIDDRKIE